MSTKVAIGYLRVSTEGQAMDGVSLDAQRARVQAWSQANGLDLVAMFQDAGISGKRADNRPQLQNALTEVCRRKGVLVVYSLSRLARSTKDTLALAEQLDKAGADLISLSEKIDTTSAAGRMIFRMLAVLSEFERDCIAERTSAALRYKRSKGERVGGIPFGYTLADDGVVLVVNEPEQSIIRTMRELRDSGLSYQAIADRLNAEGIGNRSGGKWYCNHTFRILKRVA